MLNIQRFEPKKKLVFVLDLDGKPKNPKIQEIQTQKIQRNPKSGFFLDF
jgi:hypothetical protein